MQQFIGREDWLDRFKNYLWQEEGVVWRITGQPGIGKSTLLRRFEHTCEHAERPNVWLDLEGFTPAQGLEVLAAMASAARFFDTEKANKGWKEKAGEGFKTVSGGLIGVLELGKDLIPGGGLAVGAAKVLVGLGEGVAGSAAQISENAAAAHPELYLLDALAKAGEKHPVCLIDTYEHILRNDLKIQSRLVLGYGQAREGNAKTVSLSAWLADVFEYLKDKGWRIVMAGREVPRSKPNDQLPRFSRDEILQAARIRPALAEYLPAQESAIASVLSTLSFEGNPLWLQVAMNLLENLLMEGKDLAQLAQQPEYLHECFEADDPFDTGAYDGIEHGRCKLTLISTLTRHISDLEDQAWKIALPHVLDKGIVMQLFAPQQTNAILHNFKLAGVFRVAGQQFTLHEEIRDLLLAYARSKGWLDTDEIRTLHGKLWDYLNQTHGKDLDNYPHVWMAEACYQRIMSGVGLLDKQIDPKTFWWELGGATGFSLPDKWQIVSNLPDTDPNEFARLQENLIEEKQWLYQLLDAETVDKLHKDLSDAVIASPWELSYWQKRVTDYGLVNDYYVLQDIQEDPVEKIQIIDQMLAIHGESAVSGVQEQCAAALCNKGVTLGEKLNDPLGAVVVYDSLLRRYGESAISGVQEQCARALFNKGVTLVKKLNDPEGSVMVYNKLLHRYGESIVPGLQKQCATARLNKGITLVGKLNDPLGAVVVYDSLLHRYGESAVPDVQEQCAKALFNKGCKLYEKLNDPLGAIVVYDSLLHHYGDSAIPGVQEQCAKALFNKGVTLVEKFNDPAGAVVVYDSLLHRYGDSAIPGVQEQCATALFNKGMTLANKFGDPAGAVAVYDDLLYRYGEILVYDIMLQLISEYTVPGVQEQCAKALFNKGVILAKQFKLIEAMECYTQLLENYGSLPQKKIKDLCKQASDFIAKFRRVQDISTEEDATNVIQEMLEQLQPIQQEFAILPFLLWLEEAGVELDDVLAAIRTLSPEVEFTWSWDDIRPLVDKLPELRKTQAECFIAFFEQHHDIAQLESCLWLPNQHEPNSA